MEYLKQSTAATVKLGPFLDDTDGKTAETALAIAQVDIRLSKNGGAFAQTNNAAGATHDEKGWYGVPLNTTDTATLGRLRVAVHESGALPCFAEFMVVTANVYDSLCSTDKFQVDVTQLLGTAWLAPGVAGTPDVNAKQLGGTAQTGRDIGTSVLLSSGSGAGQLDFTSGVVKSNLAQILGTALTETAGWLAAGFKKLFNVATPVLVASDIMRGTDSANTTTPPTVSAIVNEWETQSQADPTGFHVNVKEVNGTAQTANDNGADINAILTDTGTTLETHLTDIKGGTFAGGTDSLEAIRDRGDSAWTTGAGGSDRLLMVDTTIATLASQTSFTLTAGSTDDDAYNNCTIVIEDASTATQKAVGVISNYAGGTKTITLKYDPAIFAITTTDKVYILAENALKSTLANRQLNVAADGDIAGNVDGSVASVTGHTAQTGDSFAVVNHADHGNAKLVRSTTPANKLDVSASGEAGLDFDNIKNASGAHTLTNITVPVCTTNTDMVGTDSAALASGVQLSAQGKLDVNAECDTALTGYDAPTKTEQDTAFTEIKGATWAAGTDTLEHIRDKETDIETDTQDIQSRIPAALVTGRMSSDAVAISGSTDAADKLEASAETIVVGAAIAGTLSTTQMTTDLTEATNDHFNGCVLIWTSGVLIHQRTGATDYDGASKMLTYTATTEAPGIGDTFVLL